MEKDGFKLCFNSFYIFSVFIIKNNIKWKGVLMIKENAIGKVLKER